MLHIMILAGAISHGSLAQTTSDNEDTWDGSSLSHQESYSPFKISIRTSHETFHNAVKTNSIFTSIEYYSFDASEPLYVDSACEEAIPSLWSDLRSTDSFLIYLIDSSIGLNSTSLQSKVCASKGRVPLASLMTLGSGLHLTPGDLEREIFYLLGFSLDRLSDYKKINGEVETSDTMTVATPSLIRVARKVLNCPQLQGLELTVEEGGRLQWKIPGLGEDEDRVDRILNLAMLEDSGWYWINWSSIEVSSNIRIKCPVFHETARKLQSCTPSIAHCLDCDEDGKCIECKSGYYVRNGYCTSCSNSINYCDICSQDGGTCYVCRDRYYPETDKKSCKGEWYFGNCEIASRTEKKCLKCAIEYYVDEDGTCSKCDFLIRNCEWCSENPDTCISCKPGYYLHGNSCIECDKAVTNCDECTGNGESCSLCRNGYFLSENFCLPCDTHHNHCTECSREGSMCLECEEGYYPSEDSTCVSCEEFAPNCMKCTKNLGCLRYYPGNIYISNNESIECSERHPYCIECIDQDYCLKCSHEAYLEEGICYSCDQQLKDCGRCDSSGTKCFLCKRGFYLDKYQGCQACNSVKANCVDCSKDGMECLVCEIGYYKDGKICKACDEIKSNCEECSDSTCYSCKTGFFLKDGHCYPCYYSIEHCSVCSDDGSQCLYCKSGYHNDNNQCTECSVNHCSMCDESRYICTLCEDEYFLKDEQCERCDEQFDSYFVEKCDSSGGILSCRDGSVLIENLCVPCYRLHNDIDGYSDYDCQVCNKDRCLECNRYSYLTDNGCSRCYNLDDNCSHCSADGQECYECYSNMFPNGKECKKCASDIPNCASCSKDDSECFLCNDGYYWNGNKCNECGNAITDCTHCSMDGLKCLICTADMCASQDGTSCVTC